MEASDDLKRRNNNAQMANYMRPLMPEVYLKRIQDYGQRVTKELAARVAKQSERPNGSPPIKIYYTNGSISTRPPEKWALEVTLDQLEQMKKAAARFQSTVDIYLSGKDIDGSNLIGPWTENTQNGDWTDFKKDLIARDPSITPEFAKKYFDALQLGTNTYLHHMKPDQQAWNLRWYIYTPIYSKQRASFCNNFINIIKNIKDGPDFSEEQLRDACEAIQSETIRRAETANKYYILAQKVYFSGRDDNGNADYGLYAKDVDLPLMKEKMVAHEEGKALGVTPEIAEKHLRFCMDGADHIKGVPHNIPVNKEIHSIVKMSQYMRVPALIIYYDEIIEYGKEYFKEVNKRKRMAQGRKVDQYCSNHAITVSQCPGATHYALKVTQVELERLKRDSALFELATQAFLSGTNEAGEDLRGPWTEKTWNPNKSFTDLVKVIQEEDPKCDGDLALKYLQALDEWTSKYLNNLDVSTRTNLWEPSHTNYRIQRCTHFRTGMAKKITNFPYDEFIPACERI